MSRRMTRKAFLGLGVRAVGAGVAGAIIGCGDDDDVSDDAGMTETTVGSTTGGTTGTPTTGTTGGPTTGATTEATTESTTGTTGVGDTTTGGTETVGMPVCDEVEAEVGPPSVGPEHGHVVTIPAADVAAGRTTTYMLSMDLGHVHEVTVTQEMFAMLQQGEQVIADTLVDATVHLHPVTITCV